MSSVLALDIVQSYAMDTIKSGKDIAVVLLGVTYTSPITNFIIIIAG